MAQQIAKTNANNPGTLYEQCICSYVAKLNYNVTVLENVQLLRCLPPGVLIDVYVMMSRNEAIKDMLFEQISDLEVFARLLLFGPARQKLFACLTALVRNNRPLADQLQINFTLRYKVGAPAHTHTNKTTATTTRTSIKGAAATHEPKTRHVADGGQHAATTSSNLATSILTSTTTRDSIVDDVQNEQQQFSESNTAAANAALLAEADALAAADDDEQLENAPSFSPNIIDFGLRLGSFLSEAGWLSESIAVLDCVARLLNNRKLDMDMLIVRLDCLQRLLHSEAALCSFKAAERTFDRIVDLLKEIAPESLPRSLLANTYTQFSAMYFARSEYDDSHMWSVVAMRHLDDGTPERIAVDVLRQAAKACVVKRDFQRANMLICQATRRARKVFGPQHQKYADTLLDYGFFLLNVDSVYQSVNVYKEALDIKRSIFGNRNFHVAIAHEDLSYAFYVQEYSTGNFTCAREHVEKAVDIMKDLVPSDHLMLASAKRVKALLLEEIALDKMAEGVNEEGLLKQSEELHKFALQLSLEAFGEVNVQTAKHYGNLGRLYQTMNRFEEAERMHLKAIKIKTDLLGPYDYEVGLSIGHLASLYNYQMKKYREAEQLYLRSIEISLRLFGRSYSGLEYDYLGLCHVYETLREFEKYLNYATILENWQVLRGQNVTMNKSIYPAISEDCSLEEVKQQFFNMCTHNVTACN